MVNDMVDGKVKVVWKDICMLKSDGGLRIHPLKTWNYSLMAYHLWDVVLGKDSLWVKWIHIFRLRGRNF